VTLLLCECHYMEGTIQPQDINIAYLLMRITSTAGLAANLTAKLAPANPPPSTTTLQGATGCTDMAT
jgi:hypothetical protein